MSLTSNECTVLTGEQLANFNDCFASVGPVLASKISSDNTIYLEN